MERALQLAEQNLAALWASLAVAEAARAVALECGNAALVATEDAHLIAIAARISAQEGRVARLAARVRGEA